MVENVSVVDDYRDVLFYGASDDLIELELLDRVGEDQLGVDTGEEWGCWDETPAYFLVEHGKDRMGVVVYYTNKGCWFVAPVMVDEGVPLPKWDWQVIERTGYSMGLRVKLPVGCVVSPVYGIDEDMIGEKYTIPAASEKVVSEDMKVGVVT